MAFLFGVCFRLFSSACPNDARGKQPELNHPPQQQRVQHLRCGVVVHLDVLSAGRASGRYLTACANDFCREAKRQTISAQDVMQAIKELEFGELEEPLKEYLDQVRYDGLAPPPRQQQVG